MLLFEQIKRIQILHRLIMLEATGEPQMLANRIHIGKRQLYNLLDELKDMGADIKYSRLRKTFYYNNDFNINIECNVTIK